MLKSIGYWAKVPVVPMAGEDDDSIDDDSIDDDSIKEIKPEDIKLLERPAILTHIFKFAANNSKSAYQFARVSQAFEETATDYPMDTWVVLLQREPLKALKVLKKLPLDHAETVKAIATCLKNPDWQVRQAAAKALGQINPSDRQLLEQIVDCLKDRNAGVRGGVFEFLMYGASCRLCLQARIEGLYTWIPLQVLIGLVNFFAPVKKKCDCPAVRKYATSVLGVILMNNTRATLSEIADTLAERLDVNSATGRDFYELLVRIQSISPESITANTKGKIEANSSAKPLD